MTLAERIDGQPMIVRRVFALLSVLLAVALILYGVIDPIRYVVRSQESWRTAVRAQLARDRGIASIGPKVREELLSLSTAPIWNRFYAAEGKADATQFIQRDVLSLCTAVRATIQSATPLPAVDAIGLRSGGVRIVASMSVDQMKEFFEKVRAHPQYLRVQRLSVSAPQSQSQNMNPVLSVTMDIAGYSRL
jgi:hypothetical protein